MPPEHRPSIGPRRKCCVLHLHAKRRQVRRSGQPRRVLVYRCPQSRVAIKQRQRRRASIVKTDPPLARLQLHRPHRQRRTAPRSRSPPKP